MKPGKGLLIAIGKDKPGPPEPMMDEPETEEGSGDFDQYADQMFQALQEEDVEGFKLALRGCVEALGGY